MRQDYIPCPVCGKHKFPKQEDNGTCFCPHCGWAHDSSSEIEPAELSDHNDLCMDNYKLRYEYYLEQNPNYYYMRDKYPIIPQIEPIVCPVCGKYDFEPLTWDDIYCGVTPSDVSCQSCGWQYDLKQMQCPDMKDGANILSLNEYRMWYEEMIKENPEYNYFEESVNHYVPSPHKCPVCRKFEFADISCHNICPHCGWEDDGTENSDEINANKVTFTEYSKRYISYLAANPGYDWKKDGCT